MLAATVLAAFQASAITVTVDHVAGYFVNDGEFNVTPITGSGYGANDLYKNNSGAVGFGTFCINRDVPVTAPGQYDATVIASGIDPNNGNQISLGTAWLFQQFAQGVLANYNYNPLTGRQNSAYSLQIAIWILESQYPISSIVPGSNVFLNQAFSMFGAGVGGVGGAYANNNQVYSVGVLGLTTLDANGRPTKTAAQPMLTLLPDGGSALFLLGMSLSGLALISRKMRA